MARAQFPALSIGFLILFLTLAVVLLAVFLIPLVTVAINLTILYFIFLHLRAEFTKRKRQESYLIGLVAALLLVVLIGNLLPVWKITTVAILTLLLGKLYIAATKP
ncbi:MAG: hypothetical protein C4541_11575 [Candidatus Auribacter fodinae]|uniref:Uncharacterized protein n=1 Tax=Candidatus Auribacter fodinae TaxID=2093366 RepID=A0A3A4QWV8_9BACT|nr:MAG: hypothetical protein C4541_11575 [Candidatus Auribacter fodinae]